MNRTPSPLNRTTVLDRVKASLATLGGCAGLDPVCAPWFLKLWAMDEWELRIIAAMKEVEGKLDDELHEKVTRLLVELTAYDMMHMLHEIQAERARRAFGK